MSLYSWASQLLVSLQELTDDQTFGTEGGFDDGLADKAFGAMVHGKPIEQPAY